MPGLESLHDWVPFLGVLAISIAILAISIPLGRWMRGVLGAERRLPIQMGGVALAAFAIVALALLLPTSEKGPITEAAKSQLLSLIGVAFAATLTLSSTTLAGNVLAGWMLRAVGSFRSGDFIRTGDHFGRVTERGFFHVEIQTEERDLVTLPNMFLATHPIRVVRSSGTFITAEVSLGYDVPHARVERALKEAAESCGLSDPYVLITELLDHAVVYRACGFLKDPRTLVSTRSALRVSMLDALHGNDIEIVSPGFIFQRRVDGQRVIAQRVEADTTPAPAIEDVAFDKAQEAEDEERLKEQIRQLREAIKASRGDETADPATIDQKQAELEALESRLEAHANESPAPETTPTDG